MTSAKITESKIFCPMPWTSARITADGKIGICGYGRNIGNSSSAEIGDILNGSTVNEIRQSIKNEMWHSHCDYCRQCETSGGRSDRLNQVKSMTKKQFENIESNYDKHILEFVSIQLNNVCNLACNYCGPGPSSTWGKILNVPVITSTVADKGIQYLLENRDKLKHITLGGGEPLLQKQIVKLLTHITHPVIISITTNLGVDLETNLVFNRIVQQKNLDVKWMISFEGIGDKFEYVRHGATWDQFRKNIDTLKYYNQTIHAHPAYSIYCGFDLNEFYNFCTEVNLPIVWCDIFDPPELDMRFLPTSMRSKASESIDIVINKYKSATNLSINILQMYQSMLPGGIPLGARPEISDRERSIAILKFNEKIEKLLPKKKSFAELWPELHTMLIKESQ